MVLDTGAAVTSIDPEAISRATGRSTRHGKKTTLRRGKAGPLKFKKIKAHVHQMDHLALALGYPVDGILGFNAFYKMLLTLDYHAGEVRVEMGELPPVDEVEIFHDLGDTRPYIRLDIGEKTVPVLIDSGFAGGLDLNIEDQLDWLKKPTPVSMAVRYSEIVIQRAGRTSQNLAFGPLLMEQPVIHVSEGTRLAGAKLLSRFKLTFDHQNRRIRMLTDSDATYLSGPIRDLGLGVRPRTNGMEVINIFGSLPAQEADIRIGDLLIAVDGNSVLERDCERLYQPDNPDPVVLTLQREGEVFDVELTPSVLVP